MRKSEYEAMLIDDLGKIHDMEKLDTSFKVMKALEEMDRVKVKTESKERGKNTLLSWLIQKKRV